MSRKWIKVDLITMCLKKDQTFLIKETLKWLPESKWFSDNIIGYEHRDPIITLHYRTTKNGIFIRFLIKDNKDDEIGYYCYHFVPYNNIILFELWDPKECKINKKRRKKCQEKKSLKNIT